LRRSLHDAGASYHARPMSDLEPRSPRTPRHARQQRAYNLVVAGGAASLVFVVGLVLALVTSFPGWVPVVALIVAIACAVMFRRTVGR
jgi:hypothetical protein